MSLQMKPISKIKTGLGIQKGGPVHLYLTQRCKDHMVDYIPYDGGNLSEKLVDVKPGKITYNAPYAHYMYIGKVMGPNIPIKENGIVVGWFSPKDKEKHYTGADIDYSKSVARGHLYAGPYWDKRMWSAEKDEVIAEVQAYMRRGGK